MSDRRRLQDGNGLTNAPPTKKLKDNHSHSQPPPQPSNSRNKVSSGSQAATHKLPDRTIAMIANLGGRNGPHSTDVIDEYRPTFRSYAHQEFQTDKDPKTTFRTKTVQPPLNVQEETYLRQFRRQPLHDPADEINPDLGHGSDAGHESVVQVEGLEGRDNVGDRVGKEAEEYEDDEVVVRDLTKLQKRGNGRTSKARGKVLVKDFDCEDLAHYARRCVRYAICVLEMFPTDDLFAWDILEDDLANQNEEGKPNGIRLHKALRALDGDTSQRKDLITYMNYGQSSVRYAFAQHTRTAIVEFYQLSGSDGATKSSIVNWLTTDYRFHYDGLNIEERKVGDHPFLCSFIGQILRGYLIDGKPRLDEMLVKEIHRTQAVPIRVIALVGVTIYHCLLEHASGSGRNNNDVSSDNLDNCYYDLMTHLEELRDNTPKYLQLLQQRLYAKMITKPRVAPASHFNYDALTAFAEEEKETEERDEQERKEMKRKRDGERKKEERKRRELEKVVEEKKKAAEKEKERRRREVEKKKEEKQKQKEHENQRKKEEDRKREKEEERRIADEKKAAEQKKVGGKKSVSFASAERKSAIDLDLSMDEYEGELEEQEGGERKKTAGNLFDSDDKESSDEEMLPLDYAEGFGHRKEEQMGSDGLEIVGGGLDGQGVVAEEIDMNKINEDWENGDEITDNGEGVEMELFRRGQESLPSIEVLDDREEPDTAKAASKRSRGGGVEQKVRPVANLPTRRSSRNKAGEVSSEVRIVVPPRVISGARLIM